MDDRNFGLYVDGIRVPVETYEAYVNGINVVVTFRTTLGAIRGEYESPRLERAWGSFKENEHVEVRSDPAWPSGGIAKIIGVTPPATEAEREATFTIRALTEVYRKGALFLVPGQTGRVPAAWLYKTEGLANAH